MKKNIFKKVLASVASLAMVTTLLPGTALTALAADSSMTVNVDPDYSTTVATYATVTESDTTLNPIAASTTLTTVTAAGKEIFAASTASDTGITWRADKDTWVVLKPALGYEYKGTPTIKFTVGGDLEWKTTEPEEKIAEVVNENQGPGVYAVKLPANTFVLDDADKTGTLGLEVAKAVPVEVKVIVDAKDGVTVKEDATNYGWEANRDISGKSTDFDFNLAAVNEDTKTVKGGQTTAVLNITKTAEYGDVYVKVNGVNVNASAAGDANIAVGTGFATVTLTRADIMAWYMGSATDNNSKRESAKKEIKVEIGVKDHETSVTHRIDASGDASKIADMSNSRWGVPYVYRDENGNVIADPDTGMPANTVEKVVQGSEYKFTVELDNTVEATAANGYPVVIATGKASGTAQTLERGSDGVYTLKMEDSLGYNIDVTGWKLKAFGKVIFTPAVELDGRFEYFVQASGVVGESYTDGVGFKTAGVSADGSALNGMSDNTLAPTKATAGAAKPYVAAEVTEGEISFKIKFLNRDAAGATAAGYDDDAANDRYGTADTIIVKVNGAEVKATDGVYTATVAEDEETVITVEGVVTLYRVDFPTQNGFKVEVEDGVSVHTLPTGKKYVVVEDETKFRFKLVPDTGVDMSDAVVKLVETTGNSDDSRDGSTIGIQPDGWYEFRTPLKTYT